MKTRDWITYWAVGFGFIIAMNSYMDHVTNVWGVDHWQFWLFAPTLVYVFSRGVLGLLQIRAVNRARKRHRQSID